MDDQYMLIFIINLYNIFNVFYYNMVSIMDQVILLNFILLILNYLFRVIMHVRGFIIMLVIIRGLFIREGICFSLVMCFIIIIISIIRVRVRVGVGIGICFCYRSLNINCAYIIYNIYNN